MKILVGVDDSHSAAVVSGAIMRQFQPGRATLRLLHVLQPAIAELVPQMSKDYAPELGQESKEAHALLDRVATTLRSAGFDITTSVEVGDVREKIIDCAAATHADLVMVGSHGRRGVQRFLIGSVAEFVARHAACSVEIVRPSPARN